MSAINARALEKYGRWEDIPIEEVGWSTRVYHYGLLANGIKTLGDLLNLGRYRFSVSNNIGRKSVEEVLEVMDKCGLRDIFEGRQPSGPQPASAPQRRPLHCLEPWY